VAPHFASSFAFVIGASIGRPICGEKGTNIMKRLSWVALLACGLLVPAMVQRGLAQEDGPGGNLPAGAADGTGATYVIFDGPDQGCNGGACTMPVGVDSLGGIGGYYFTAEFFPHGFYRKATGEITTFDPPGAFCNTRGLAGCSYVSSMNLGGDMVGWYFDGTEDAGFLRDREGNFVEFVVPNSDGTGAEFINSAGVIAGTYHYGISGNPYGGWGGFMRDAQAKITTFLAPAGFDNVDIAGMNSHGEIVGSYSNEGAVQSPAYGFLRHQDGSLTVLSHPGWSNVYAGAISDSGLIAGTYISDADGYLYDFLLDRQGNYTTIAMCPSPPTTYDFTDPIAFDAAGSIIGTYEYYRPDAGHLITAGCYRLKDGRAGSFHPDSDSTSAPIAVGPHGEIVEIFVGLDGLSHAFLRRSRV